MAAAERVNKFYEDALKFFPPPPATRPVNNCNKVIAEINKLKIWLQKHQNEVLPDSLKAKLFQCMEIYYRQQVQSIELRDSVTDMLSCYLQLPEGRLLVAKDKRKVLQWLRSLSIVTEIEHAGEQNSSSSTWVVQEIEDTSKQLVTLLNCNDEEAWRENVAVQDEKLFKSIVHLINEGSSNVVVEMDDKTNEVIRVISS